MEKTIHHKTYSLDKNELVIPYKCACCNKCWMVVSGKRTGRCVHGGPYLGYIKMEKEKDYEEYYT